MEKENFHDRYDPYDHRGSNSRYPPDNTRERTFDMAGDDMRDNSFVYEDDVMDASAPMPGYQQDSRSPAPGYYQDSRSPDPYRKPVAPHPPTRPERDGAGRANSLSTHDRMELAEANRRMRLQRHSRVRPDNYDDNVMEAPRGRYDE